MREYKVSIPDNVPSRILARFDVPDPKNVQMTICVPDNFKLEENVLIDVPNAGLCVVYNKKNDRITVVNWRTNKDRAERYQAHLCSTPQIYKKENGVLVVIPSYKIRYNTYKFKQSRELKFYLRADYRRITYHIKHDRILHIFSKSNLKEKRIQNASYCDVSIREINKVIQEKLNKEGPACGLHLIPKDYYWSLHHPELHALGIDVGVYKHLKREDFSPKYTRIKRFRDVTHALNYMINCDRFPKKNLHKKARKFVWSEINKRGCCTYETIQTLRLITNELDIFTQNKFFDVIKKVNYTYTQIYAIIRLSQIDKTLTDKILKQYEKVGTFFVRSWVWQDMVRSLDSLTGLVDQKEIKTMVRNCVEINTNIDHVVGQLHNEFSELYQTLKDKLYTTPFKYTEESEKLVDKKDKYEFVLPMTPQELKDWGRKLNHCVYSYNNDVRSQRETIIGVKKEDKLLACVEVKDGRIYQVKGNCNVHIYKKDKEFAKMFDKWTSSKNLELIGH